MNSYDIEYKNIWDLCDSEFRVDNNLYNTETVPEDFVSRLIYSLCNGIFIGGISVLKDEVIDGNKRVYVMRKALYEGNYVFYDFTNDKITVNPDSSKEYIRKEHEYDIANIYDTFDLLRLLEKEGNKAYSERMIRVNSILQQYTILLISYYDSMIGKKDKIIEYTNNGKQ